MFFPTSGRHVGAHVHGHQHGVSILISINLCETWCQITRVWNTAQTWGLDRVLIYLSSIACKFLDFIHWMVFDFYFDGVTVKTGYCTWQWPTREPKLLWSPRTFYSSCHCVSTAVPVFIPLKGKLRKLTAYKCSSSKGTHRPHGLGRRTKWHISKNTISLRSHR